MDIHRKIAAGIHIALAGFELLVLAFVTLVFMGVLGAGMMPQALPLDAMLAGFMVFGSVMLACFALLALAQLAAAICFLRGSSAARVWLIVFSVLMLFNFPVGTLLGGYCIWALVRQPATGTVIIIDNRAE
jgi:hypothetical protein